MTDRQTLENQRGEINFRKKLVSQQVDAEQIFTDEFDKSGIESILQERMDDTLRKLSHLSKQGIILSPYLEIGAERCQRSMVVETDLNSRGIAIDLSFDMLRSGEYYSKVWTKDLPLRICADLYNTPLKSGSLPFIFCYQTLHHFPDPRPLVAEMHRILSSGGVFYFDEEPFKKGFHLNLYKTQKVFSSDHINRNVLRKVLDHFFAEYINNEEEHGVIENDDISIASWRRTFNIFNDQEITLSSPGSISSGLYGSKFSLSFRLNYLFGGNISGTCKKKGSLNNSINSIERALTCPICLADGQEPDMTMGTEALTCTSCQHAFPIIDGIVILMESERMRMLYPQFENKME
ncbi:methyltransferase domain-containing protein [bacterium]|nr:methyltransferase domain-containing protein [bacterium]